MKRHTLHLILLAAATAALALWWLRWDMDRVLHTPLDLGGEQRLVVKPGTSLGAIGAELAARGWMQRPYYFKFAGKLQGRAGSVQAGEYALHPPVTPLDLLDILVSGKVIQHSLTLVEGWTFRQVMEAVRQSPELAHTLASDRPRYVMSAIGRAGTFAEGRFFPDTYHFPAGTTDVQFLRRAFRTMSRILKEAWAHRDTGLPYQSAYQALILASLVEKETAVPAERPRIAGVFVRRLEKGMKLQTDPTIIYALGKNYDGDIRTRDLSIDSPYNTYLHAGLPPTPIGLPGQASIEAALHPASGTELYFVSRGDGTHKFSSTLSEHNAAVRKFQLKNH